jgi:hypothetical protein
MGDWSVRYIGIEGNSGEVESETNVKHADGVAVDCR